MLLGHDEVLPDHVSGVALGGVTAGALTLDDWLRYQNNESVTVAIQGTVEHGSGFVGNVAVPVGHRMSARLQLDPKVRNESICLVDGGWAPLIYSLAGTNIFVDRNIVSEIKACFDNGKRKSGSEPLSDFLEMLGDKSCGCYLNPLPFALEGNTQELPTAEAVRDQLAIAVATLKQALPHIRVWPEQPFTLKDIQVLLDGYREDFSNGIRFLQKVAPSLMATTGRSRRRAAWESIIKAVQDLGLSSQHLCVAVALSALTASQGLNPAKKVLKPAAVYGPAEAYNAMWDIFLLTLLRKFQEEPPAWRSALLTRDKNLAVLWMGMTIHTFGLPNGGKPCIVFDERLFKCDAEELAFLQNLLGAENIQYENR
ncbi:hypothetical protein BLL42_00145 [Pseudomonas frederiksbergensis]|uniref:Uncharacterized protein n=1 Tax=Pseudomonas frederiksbergensis TaxID=104087 RepID=A0A1J0EDQ2_9PSED|nr:hypothetical protein [Pseudomonas frederiksbergensis]APC14229.1 hypothetical protein BLL42_00145 [Pseudomonas frederiksbergensis]